MSQSKDSNENTNKTQHESRRILDEFTLAKDFTLTLGERRLETCWPMSHVAQVVF